MDGMMLLSERAWRYRLYRLYLLLRSNRYYKDYGRRIDAMTKEDPYAMSERHLRGLLEYAGEHSTYYSELLSGEGRFRSLPVLTKDIMRGRFDDIRTLPESPTAYRNSSGGSTGRPATFIQDAHYASWSNATHGYYFREMLGVEMNTVKNLWLWGSERDSLQIKGRGFRGRAANFLTNKIFLNTFDMDESTWLEYIDVIRRYRPHYIAGYAGSLYEIARVARQHNVQLYTPVFVYSSAETLRDFMRVEIEEQFGTKVYDYYGSREVGAIAGECARGNKHVFVMNTLVEICDDDGQPVEDGNEGSLIVTCLHNYSFPMIRYEIGDVGTMAKQPCECGSRLPYLSSLSGRITDHFVLKDGKLVHGEFITHLFYFRDWVDQFQVDQVEFDTLRIRVVRRGEVDESDIEEIDYKIRLVMGQDCELFWEYVDSIEKSPQGKFVFTRCLIPDEALGRSAYSV